MCARACVCVPFRELSLSLSLSLRVDDEETKTRVLYLIEKVFSSFSDAQNSARKISKKTHGGKKVRVLIELGFTERGKKGKKVLTKNATRRNRLGGFESDLFLSSSIAHAKKTREKQRRNERAVVSYSSFFSKRHRKANETCARCRYD